jgi:hypothetical protein
VIDKAIALVLLMIVVVVGFGVWKRLPERATHTGAPAQTSR